MRNTAKAAAAAAVLAAFILTNCVFAPAAGAAELKSGECGAALEWTLDESGVLSISGAGCMDYWQYGEAPWYEYRGSILSAIIADGVSDIGDYAFCECGRMMSVTIPDTVNYIGSEAFTGCGALTSVKIPEGVSEIGYNTFFDCAGLVSAELPDSIKSIGNMAFYGCRSLKTADIPNSAEYIGDGAFFGCSALDSVLIPGGTSQIGAGAFASCTGLDSIEVSESNTHYISKNGVLMTADGKSVAAYPAGRSGGYTVPETVESVGEYAFYGSGGLSEITLSGSVRTVGKRAFADCSALGKAGLGSGLESIGEAAFRGCAELAKITVPDSVAQIGNGAFANCIKLTSIDVSSGNARYKTDDGVLLSADGKALVSFTPGRSGHYEIPEGVETVMPYSFAGSTGLEQLTVPASVSEIGLYAFDGCTGLKEVYFGGTEQIWDTVVIALGNGALDNAVMHFQLGAGECGEGLRWTLDEKGVLRISGSGTMFDWDGEDDRAPWYEHRNEIKTAVIEQGAGNIGSYAFSECVNLISVEIPSSAETIGRNAFSQCSSLGSADIPEGVAVIGKSAFELCEALENVTLPVSLEGIGDSAFYGCDAIVMVFYKGDDEQWEKVSVDPGNESAVGDRLRMKLGSGKCGDDLTWELYNDGKLTVSGTGDMYDYTAGGAPWYRKRDKIKEIVLADETGSIGAHAFGDCSGLSLIIIPDGLARIGEKAFSGCVSLRSVELPKSVASVGSGTFSGCAALRKIAVEEGNKHYRSADGVLFSADGTVLEAFPAGLSGSYTVPDGTKSIGSCAFGGCAGLAALTLPVSTVSIGRSAFDGCIGLKMVYYSGSETQWNKISIGTGNEALENADIHFAYIAKGECGGLSWVIDENGTLTVSGSGRMSDFSENSKAPWSGFGDKIISIVIGEGIVYIGDYAFLGCDRAASAILPESASGIGEGAFAGCASLNAIEVSPENKSLLSVGGIIFSTDGRILLACPAGRSGTYEVPEGVEAIAAGAFYGSGVSSVTLPVSLSEIGEKAFAQCRLLSDAVYSGTEAQWDNVTIGTGNEALVDIIRFAKTDESTGDSGGDTDGDAGETQEPEQPGGGQEDTDTGEKPDDTDETPDKPEQPDNAGDTPDSPEKPGNADETPGNPEKPGNADETPDTSDEPGNADETPDTPEEPDNTDETPDSPEEPGSADETPDDPKEPDNTDEEPDSPEKPGSADETPDIPEKPDSTEEPADIPDDTGPDERPADEPEDQDGEASGDPVPSDTGETTGDADQKPEVSGGAAEDEEPAYIPGDINGDGTVNIKDLIRLMKLLAGENVTTAASPDINGDGRVNSKDLIRLMKFIAGETVELH